MIFSDKTNALIKKATAGRKHIKLTIGVLHEDELTFKLFDSKGEIPYESHIYEIGSVGKVFATSLLAKYLQEGKMNLNDSVAKYMPELEDNKYYPTLKRLATHTAGYPLLYPMTKGEALKFALQLIFAKKTATIQDFLHMDHKRMIDLAKKSRLQDRDYKWAYSNYGISLLGYAISCVAGRDFWDIMNEYLTQDLGLGDTFLGTDSPKILTGYNTKNQNVGNWRWGKEDYLTPSGNIASNAEDLLKFAKMNIDETPSHLRLCRVRYDMNSKHSDMGLGWWIDRKNPDMFYHGGNVEGFASMLAFDKKKKSAVAILANVNYYKEREQLFTDIMDSI